MTIDGGPSRSAVFFPPVAIGIAVVLAAWLRTHGLTSQIVQDDEWHAIHKLMAASYGEILRSFGYADHSIPLTLLYKAMADWVGLTEGNMRALQAACGVALVALAPALALRATRDGAAAALYAFLLAGAPFLVLYSRFARPYAITLLLSVIALAAIWAWRGRRTLGLACAIAACATFTAWLHPIAALFPAVGCAFVFLEDVAAPGEARRNLVLSSAALGAGVAIAMAAPLAPALLNDVGSLSAKAGGDHASLHTLWRMLSIFSGGLSDGATAVMAAIGALGFWRIARADPRLGAYLGALVVLPIAIVSAIGAMWTQQGHTFARYVLPAQVIFLFCVTYGVVSAARMALDREPVRWTAAAAFAAAYLALVPTLAQVARLHEWYGHLYHHYDYGDPENVALSAYRGFKTPDFYRRLAAMPPGSAPIIEAPFTFEAPANVFAFFALTHRQPVKEGILHDLCLDGPYLGEVPRDRRFRFSEFVFLDDPREVRASGARYLVLYREQLHSRPFVEGDRCLARLAQLYGRPIEVEPRLAVFDLRAAASESDRDRTR